MNSDNNYPEEVQVLLDYLERELEDSYSETDRRMQGKNFFNGERILSRKQKKMQSRIISIHSKERMKKQNEYPQLTEEDIQKLKDLKKQLSIERRAIFARLPKSFQREIAYTINWYSSAREMSETELKLEKEIKSIFDKFNQK